MREWTKTWVVWDWRASYDSSGPPVDTNILVSNWQPGDGQSPVYWQVSKLMITLPELGSSRKIVLKIGFNYNGNCFSTPDGQDGREIIERLGRILAGRRGVSVAHTHGMYPFVACFELKGNEKFSETCMNLAIELFDSLAVRDREAMAKFRIIRQSYLYLEGRWISFSNYLRRRVGLPPVDDREQEPIF